MFFLEDYFDIGLAAKPYGSDTEQIEDRITLLRLMLMGLSEQRQQQTKSRGGIPPEAGAWIYEARYPDEETLSEQEETRSEILSALEFIKSREDAKSKVTTATTELVRMFSLDEYGKLALYLALAPEISTAVLPVYQYLQYKNETPTAPTVGLLEELYRFVFGELPFRGHRLFEDSSQSSILFLRPQKELASSRLLYPLQLVPGIIGFLTDGRVPKPDAFCIPPIDIELSSFFAKESKAIRALSESQKDDSHIIYIESEDSRDTRVLLDSVAKETGQELLCIDSRRIAESEDVVLRNSIARILVYLRLKKSKVAFFDEGEEAESTRKLMELPMARQHFKELFVFGAKKLPASVIRRDGWLSFSLALPDMETRGKIWEECLGRLKEMDVIVAEDVDPQELAYEYEISAASIQSACMAAASVSISEGENEVTRSMMGDVLFGAGEADFGELATRIKHSYSWDDLQIEKSQKDILFAAINRFRLRNKVGSEWGLDRKNTYGNGVSILLYGPPGTGKTMTAQIIAKELGLPLFRVDLSQLFSKYIGETSKNLAKVFAEASKANVVLFFDEADALFAKRTEVSDSLDKHSNAETAYLLQRIDEYRGFSILATNYFQNFDKAFVRRLTYAAHLDSPTAEERLALWQNTLPDTVPMEDDIDFEVFADNFEISGSNIKSILYSAAYLAGAEKKKVNVSHIIRAIKYEFDKMGRILELDDVGIYARYFMML